MPHSTPAKHTLRIKKHICILTLSIQKTPIQNYAAKKYFLALLKTLSTVLELDVCICKQVWNKIGILGCHDSGKKCWDAFVGLKSNENFDGKAAGGGTYVVIGNKLECFEMFQRNLFGEGDTFLCFYAARSFGELF